MKLMVGQLFRRSQAAWWTLAAGLLLTAAVAWEMDREAIALDRQRLRMRVAEVRSQLDARLEKSEMLLNNLRDFLMFSGEKRADVFARWCHENGLTINCPWIGGILVATNNQPLAWRPHFPAASETWTREDRLRLNKLAERTFFACKPMLTNSARAEHGFLPDYHLSPSFTNRSDRLAIAIRESRISMGASRSVMLDAAAQPVVGTLYFMPFYRPELNDFISSRKHLDLTKTARWMDLAGVIVAPVDFQVLSEAIWQGAAADLGIELFGSVEQTAENWLNPTREVPRAADPSFKAYLTHQLVWPMYGNKFSIYFYTTPLFEAQSPRGLAKLAGAAGVGLTLLATTLVGVVLRARTRHEHFVDQIREARDALAAAQQQRNQISRDLHDCTIQSLYAIQLGLGHTAKKLEAESVKAGSELSVARRELDAVIAELRQFIAAESLTEDSVNFCAVLQSLVQRAQAQAGSTTAIELQCESAASSNLRSDQTVQLANIAREALSNSLRHASPRHIRIVLRCEKDAVIQEITDDGKGFDPHRVRPGGVGLASMAARAQEAGGEFVVQSSLGQGTSIVVRIPVAQAEPGPNGRRLPARAPAATAGTQEERRVQEPGAPEPA